MAEVLGRTLAWVRHGEPPSDDEPPPASTVQASPHDGVELILAWEAGQELPADRYVLVPHLDAKVSAGSGQLNWHVDKKHPLAFLTNWVRGQRMNPKKLVALQTVGDSMEPRISDGDTLLVDLGQTEVMDGRIYAIRYGDELRVKRLFKRYDGALVIRSDNAEMYPEETVPPEAKTQIAVIGRVVWVGGAV